jgi:formate/nitrite transporter
MSNELQIDAFLPPKMATRMEEVGIKKTQMDILSTGVLAILAGAFIATGAIFATTVSAGSIAVRAADGSMAFSTGLPYGLVRLLSGLVFCLGLIAVVVAGAELFTGNNLIIMAFASGRVTLAALLRNWGIVYVGNFVGSVLTALLMYLTGQFSFGSGSVGLNALNIAHAKCSLGFGQAVALGIMCNALVCLAVWLCASARSTTDKILSIIFPITCFVAAGFEHSVANMYFIPVGLFIRSWAPATFWEAIGKTALDFPNLTWGAFFLRNLLPVTIGNIIGGAGFVGLVYWFVYLRPPKKVKIEAGVAPRILVVDDDPDYVNLVRAILSRDGYQIAAATNGNEALQAMKQERPDLVLLDVMMATPLEGVGVAQQMAQDKNLKNIPVIMISSIDSSEYAPLLPDDLHIPADAWINKPIDPEDLLRKVRRFLVR